MSYTKEQLVEQLQSTLDILTAPAPEAVTPDDTMLRKVFLLGMQLGVSRAYDRLHAKQPAYLEIQVDTYADGLNITGEMEIDSEQVWSKFNDAFPPFHDIQDMFGLSGFETDEALKAHITLALADKNNDND